MQIIGRIEDEINQYLNGTTEITEGVHYSQHRLVRRIALFENKTYPKGKTDKQGRYKYWFDIIGPRRDSEVKNLRVDTKHFLVFSTQPQKDFEAVFIANAAVKEWMWDTGRAEELNANVEEYSGAGNVIFKKTPDGYEICDKLNTYVINQTARTVDETPIIERHQLTQSQMRAKAGVWKNIDEVIEHCGNRQFSATERTAERSTTNPMYEVHERNGEVSEAELLEARGESGGDADKYVLAKIVVVGIKRGAKDHKYVLFADTIKKMPYKSAHRGPYKGKFWREGMYELLFDHQVRANEIANQIARGLEWASKAVFRSAEALAAQNILTDIANGNVVRSADLQQVQVRMQGFDQLIADWNRLIADADRLANSFEVVTGESQPSGTPFRLGLLQDQNANKLFVFLRQKLTIQYKQVFKEWVMPKLLSDLKAKDVIRLTGDADMVDRLRRLQAESWLARNLVAIGPDLAVPGVKDALIEAKVAELKRSEPVLNNNKELWKAVEPRLHLTISGENMDLAEQLETLANLLQFETDPFRRAFLLDRIYKLKGIDAPPPPNPQVQQQAIQPPSDLSTQPQPLARAA